MPVDRYGVLPREELLESLGMPVVVSPPSVTPPRESADEAVPILEADPETSGAVGVSPSGTSGAGGRRVRRPRRSG